MLGHIQGVSVRGNKLGMKDVLLTGKMLGLILYYYPWANLHQCLEDPASEAGDDCSYHFMRTYDVSA